MKCDFKLNGNILWQSNGEWLLTSTSNYMSKSLNLDEVERLGSDYGAALTAAMYEYGSNICVMKGNTPRPEWKLGKDLTTSDTIIDPVTFGDLIHRLKYYYRHGRLNEYFVRREMQDIFDRQFKDVEFLLKNNMNEIIALASDEPLEDAGHDDITLEE